MINLARLTLVLILAVLSTNFISFIQDKSPGYIPYINQLNRTISNVIYINTCVLSTINILPFCLSGI